MKRLIRICVFFAYLINIFYFVFAIDFSELQELYISNNKTVQELNYKLQQTQIEVQKTLINNGIDFSLSTGDMNFDFADKNLSFEPKISLSIPQLNDSSVSLSLPMSISIDKESSTTINNGGISFSTAVLSDEKKNRQVILQKAQRDIVNAKRNLLKGTNNVKIQFLKDLKNLYSLLNDVTILEDTLIEKELDFENVLVKGYGEKTSDYILSQMAVKKAKRNVFEKQKQFEYEFTIFKNNCGKNFLENNEFTQDELVVLNIPTTKLTKISEFKKEDYAQLEEAIWNNKINTLNRQKSVPFSLYANGGYGITLDNLGKDSYETVHNLNIGLSGQYEGVSISAKGKIPLSEGDKLSITMSMGLNINQNKINKLDDKKNQITEKIELLTIDEAKENYRKDCVDFITRARDLLWQKNEYKKEKDLYIDLEKSMKQNFELGYINETKYRQAKANLLNAQLNCLLNNIECMLFNLDLESLFVKD